MLCPFRKEIIWKALRYAGSELQRARKTEEFLPCVEKQCIAYEYNKQTDTVLCKLCNN